MNILNTILESALDDNVIDTISKKSGVDNNNIQSLVKELAPKLLNGAKQNLASSNDSSSLINMISQTNLDSLKSNPSQIDSLDTNSMISELFSSLNENEEDVKNELSSKSGINSSSISSILPMLAPLVLGALNKTSNLGAMDSSNTNNITSTLLNFIDQDNDGSVVDDLMGMASKFFK